MTNENFVRLAEQIQNEQAGLVESVRHTLRHAQRIGQLLAEVKALKPKGGIDKWMEENCTFSVRTGYYHLGNNNPHTN